MNVVCPCDRSPYSLCDVHFTCYIATYRLNSIYLHNYCHFFLLPLHIRISFRFCSCVRIYVMDQSSSSPPIHVRTTWKCAIKMKREAGRWAAAHRIHDLVSCGRMSIEYSGGMKLLHVRRGTARSSYNEHKM